MKSIVKKIIVALIVFAILVCAITFGAHVINKRVNKVLDDVGLGAITNSDNNPNDFWAFVDNDEEEKKEDEEKNFFSKISDFVSKVFENEKDAKPKEVKETSVKW